MQETDYKKLIILIVLIAALFFLPVTVAALIIFFVIRYFNPPWGYVGGFCVVSVLVVLIWPKIFVLPGIGIIYRSIMLSNDRAMFNLLHQCVQSVVVTDPVAMYAPWRVVISAIATGIPVGALAAYMKSKQKIKSSQEKEDKRNFESSKFNKLLIKKAEDKYIKSASSANMEGVYLGIDRTTKKPIVITNSELNQHTLLTGTTGSGKTTTVMNFLEYSLKSHYPIIAIDGKGDPGFVRDIRALAFNYRRNVKVFSLTDPDSYNYNPVANGGATEIKDRLIAMSEWTEQHFQFMAERYLQTAINIHIAAGTLTDLVSLVSHLTPQELIHLASVAHAPAQVIDYIENLRFDQVDGLINRLSVLTESQSGRLFTISENKTIVLDEAIANRDVVVFSLDSLTYPVFARSIGKLIINDLKSSASRRYAQVRRKDELVMTIYDEFNVFASRQVVDFVNKSRGAGFASLIAIQSLADLDIVDSALKNQIIGNVNTFIIQRQNTSDDAEQFACTIGTDNVWEKTSQVNRLGETGMATRKFVKEFVCHPDIIKRLNIGEAVIVRKIPKFSVHQVNIKKINP